MKKYIYKIILLAVSVFGVIGIVILLGDGDIALLNPKGMVALAEKNLLITAVSLMLIVIIPVFILLFTFAWKYRAGNKKAIYTPEWTHNPLLELVWWAIPFIIIGILSVITWKSTHDLDPYRELDTGIKPMTIQVVALNWKWLFIYPEQGIATVNLAEFPVDTPIHFEITADAPMNSVWVPKLGGQIYAMAGMKTALNLIANEEGDYPGLSANFSGEGFSGMKFVARARTREEFDAWVAEVKGGSRVLTPALYDALAKPSKNEPVALYASVAGDLFDRIIMKYMTPAQVRGDMDMTTEVDQHNLP